MLPYVRLGWGIRTPREVQGGMTRVFYGPTYMYVRRVFWVKMANGVAGGGGGLTVRRSGNVQEEKCRSIEQTLEPYDQLLVCVWRSEPWLNFNPAFRQQAKNHLPCVLHRRHRHHHGCLSAANGFLHRQPLRMPVFSPNRDRGSQKKNYGIVVASFIFEENGHIFGYGRGYSCAAYLSLSPIV